MGALPMTQGGEIDILIAGAGVVGASCALALAQGGMRTAVIEAGEFQPELSLEPHPCDVLAIAPASRRMLDELGLWGSIAAQGAGACQSERVWDRDRRGFIEFSAADHCLPELAHFVPVKAILGVLHRALKGHANAIALSGSRIDRLHMEAHGIRASLEDGSALNARLLIGADGQRSHTRKLAGIAATEIPYRQTAIVAHAEIDQPHGGIARQIFCEQGPLAILPLRDPQSCVILWSCERDWAERMLSMPEDEYAQLVAKRFGNELGRMGIKGFRRSYPLARVDAHRYCAERIVLIGDAAHGIHPLAGLGANLGLRDARALSRILLEARAAGRDFGARRWLRQYERARKMENRLAMRGMDALQWLYGGASPPLNSLRRAGLRLLNSCAPLRAGIVAWASR